MSRGFWEFCSDLGGKVDFAVVVLSLVSMTLYIYFEYIVAEENDLEEGLTFSHVLKLLRDAARVLRLPVFLFHTFAIFRWYEAQAARRRPSGDHPL
ncbi:hypothetical protein T484DRAFT_2258333 [Baffinella frigidus]|nr:hypothetical protein T484DRAFT_2258333 [Cryptophyta sp. CCMP2293]